MIIEISVENYLSIKDKITLSLESGPSKKLMNNLIKIPEDEKLIKTAAIYGPNAAGKSNIIKSVFFIWRMVKFSHQFNVDIEIPKDQFKLEKKYLKKPSKFEIIFIHNNIKYKYGFSCNRGKFIEEYLCFWKNGRGYKDIFKRKNSKDFEFNKNKKQQKSIKSQTNDNVLYLSRATQLGNEATKDAYEFIVNIIINFSHNWVDITANNIYENLKSKEKIIDILQKADFGGIIDIEVAKEKKEVQGFEFKVGDKGTINPNPIKRLEEKEFYDIKFIRKTKEGEYINFGFDEESDGTRKTFAILGPIFEILETGKVLFVDELESSLHPNITKFLIKLFHSKLNSKNAQLIFTTHNTNLLDNEIFRKDQIYFCSKNKDNSTELNSCMDYDITEDSDFERAYLNGRVGGLPFIDESGLD